MPPIHGQAVGGRERDVQFPLPGTRQQLHIHLLAVRVLCRIDTLVTINKPD